MKKLKNEQGVTILMALLLVLTAAVVSAVILSAALSAARRVNGDRTAQQNYLAVSSAAELVRDSIDQMRYTETTTTTYEWDEENGSYLQTGQLLHREAADRPDGRLAHGRRAERRLHRYHHHHAAG